MKINHFFLSALVLLTLQACQPDNRESNQAETRDQKEQPPAKQETPQKLIEYLVGEWQLQNGQGGDQGTPKPSDRLRFTEEARYIAYSGGQKVDSGAYRMNEQLRNLYLESEANERPREFEIDLQEDRMTLTPKSETGQKGSYSYRRVSR